MYLSKWVMVIAAVCLITLSGCSHTASPVESVIGDDVHPVGDKKSDGHSLLGLYTFVCQPETDTVEVIPLRDADLHLNALKFLEPPAFLYLTIEGPPEFNENILTVDIGLTHPFLGQDIYTGFDVCGIIFTHGSITGFSDPDIVLAGEGDTRLLNADGYTRWWNPAEFPHGNTIHNYIDGLFGNPVDTADFNCTLNAFKYFADALEKDEPLTAMTPEHRGVFSAGKKNIRQYIIDLSGELVFNYAVDACWKFPQGEPPYEVPDDFPPLANRPEAWNISVTEVTNSLYYQEGIGSGSGELKLLIDVWDHFNAGANKVSAESLAGFPLTIALTPVGGGEGFSTYEIDFAGEDLIQSGDADILITVESDATGYGNVLTDKPVCAYFKHSFHISYGWARTWGGNERTDVFGVAVDGSGNAYVMGNFLGTVDFDPGPGIDEYTSNGWTDIFLCKFDPMGSYQWCLTWGGIDLDFSNGVAVDESGNAYITGFYFGTMDFDPGPGVDERTSSDDGSIYLSKFTPNGDFQWCRTWGGGAVDRGQGVAVDGSDSVYVVGFFWGFPDFDPGLGVDEHASNGESDIFLCKLNANGDFQWARTWGGSDSDSGEGVAIDISGNAYVTGTFRETVDFDPGTGVDERASNGQGDIFLGKFDLNGDFQWARTWGGFHYDNGRGVAVDGDGNAAVTGAFRDTVDFDPGPGIDEHTSIGSTDIFLSKLDSNGVFQWARTWDGGVYGCGPDVDIDGSGNTYVAGYFGGTVDFDPGPEEDVHISNGNSDCSLSKFDTEGDLKWAHTWGGSGSDHSIGVACDGDGNAFVAGVFEDTVDFDPGPGVDEHAANGYHDAFLSKFPPDGNW